MEWHLSFSTDGSFREELLSPQTSYSSGYHATATAGSCTLAGSSNGSILFEPSRRSSSGVDRSGGGGGSHCSNTSGSGSWEAAAAPGSGSAYCCAPGVCWGSDDAGCPRRLQLDDEESLLLSTWIRAGMWVLPSVAAQLSIREVPPPSACSNASPGGEGDGEEAPRQRHAEAGPSGGRVWLELRLKQGGRVRCRDSLMPDCCPSSG